MINVLLTSDEEDEKLGEFLETCTNELKKLFSSCANMINLTSKMIKNDIVINQRITELNKNFVFIALTHGSDSELVDSYNNPYVAVGMNDDKFQGTLFYNFSCNTANLLGKEIINKKGKCFVGHNQKVYASNTGVWKDLFFQPILYFWGKFISGNTVNSCLQEKKVEYTRLIDNIYEEDMLHAAFMRINRDSLVVYGDENCCIKDFIT